MVMIEIENIKKFMAGFLGGNLFDDFFDDSFGMMNARSPLYGKHARNLMKTDIRETDTNYELAIDLPGFKKEDIHVDVDGDTMTIRAERHSEHEDQDKKGNYVRCERSYGSYQRAFDISGVEVANISAQYNDGVLKLNMPKKSAVVNAKQIEIQ